jgi:hypothetical protein
MIGGFSIAIVNQFFSALLRPARSRKMGQGLIRRLPYELPKVLAGDADSPIEVYP